MRSTYSPCLPTAGKVVPATAHWLHEVKYDGYRLIVAREGKRVRLFTRNGHNWSGRYPWIVEAARKNRRKQFVIDGEALAGRWGPCLRSFAFALFLCLPSLAAAQQPQYNPYTDRYEYTPKARETLQYDPYKREYAPEGAVPRYNPYTKRRELVGPGETLQYNPYAKEREYAPEGAMPRYNPYTKRRELVGPRETLQYNPYAKEREYAPEGAMPRYNPY